MVEIMPVLNYSSSIPIYVQLYEYIKKEIQNGTIKPGTKLPSKRKLAKFLGISQNTVHTAFEQLSSEGYVESKMRVGLFVKKLEDSISISEFPMKFDNETEKNQIRYKLDFNSGYVDLDNFPYTTWRKLTIQSLYSEQGNLLLMGDPQGEENLRIEIAKYLFQSRGVKCTKEQIVIGSGTQYLLMLLTLLLGKDYAYAMEDPGYNRARSVFIDQGIDVIPISVEEDGICIDALRKSPAKVVYITPSHQFPTGTIMPISKRLELLKWCEDNTGYVIEDDYDSEFRYKGKPIPSLQGLDSKGNVIYLGTFSKSLIPTIRISYLVLPQKLLKIYNNHFNIYKQTVSRLHQDTLCSFMKQGHFSSHLNKMRNLYRKKHEILISSIIKQMNDKVEIKGEKSGLHVLMKVKNKMTEKELIEAAGKMKIKVYPTSIHYAEERKGEIPVILLGFGGLTGIQIEEGIAMLKEAWNIT